MRTRGKLRDSGNPPLVTCCWEVLRKVWNRSNVKLRANKKKNKQQLPTLLAQQRLELLRPFARILNCEVFRYPSLLCTAEKVEPLRPIFSVIFYYLIYRIIKANIFQIWSTIAGCAVKFMPIENGEIFSMHDNEWLSDVRLSLDLIPFIRNLKMFVDKMPILTSLIPTTVSFGMKSPPLNVREIQGWRPSRISKKGCWLKTTWYRRAVVYYSSDLVTPCKTLFEVFPGVEETIAS